MIMIEKDTKDQDLYSRVRSITDRIKYKDWFILHSKNEPRTIQVCFFAHCIESGMTTEQKGRKWLISQHMTDSEIIQTAFLAIKVAEEHELRENFLYKGAQIFGPHMNLNAIAEDINIGILKEDKRDA